MSADDSPGDEPVAGEPLPAWLAGIDPDTMRGLEIGALHHPRFDRARTDVSYVDHADTDELRQKYATDEAMAGHLDEIVEVDFVWAGGARLADVVGEAGPYDFVYASHVAEHAPDLIGWLDQVGEVLVDGGLLALALPDQRLCFDVNRNLTEMSDLVDAHLRGLHAPGYRQIYDFHATIVAVDPASIWAGEADYAGQQRTDLDPDQWAYELCLKHRQTGEYIDGHCSVFTPDSFLDLYRRLVALDLIGYRIAGFETTQVNTIEFHVVLEKLPDDLDTAERHRRQLASVPTHVDDLVPSGPAVATVEAVDLSPREQRLLDTKRRVLGLGRSGLASLRHDGVAATVSKGLAMARSRARS